MDCLGSYINIVKFILLVLYPEAEELPDFNLFLFSDFTILHHKRMIRNDLNSMSVYKYELTDIFSWNALKYLGYPGKAQK